MSNELDRRRFLELTAAGAVTASTGLGLKVAGGQDESFTPMSEPGRVVKVTHSRAMRDPNEPGSDPESDVVHVMVDAALMAYAGTADIGEAWRRFIALDDRVMIKVNALGSPNMATNKPVVEAIVRGLQAMGLPSEQILIYDQYGNRMRRAGLRPGGDVLGAPVEFSRNQGYGDTVDTPSGETRWARAIENVTAVINVPVIKDHDICGVTMSLKNMTHGVTEEPSRYHRRHRDEGCTVHSDIYGQSMIKDKVRLIVCDGLRVLFDGGPQDNDAKELHNAIYVSTDPVATDTIGYDVVTDARSRNGKNTLEDDGRPCNWLAVCAAAGLGVHDREQIRVEEHSLG